MDENAKINVKLDIKTYRVIEILSVKYENMYDRFSDILDKILVMRNWYRNDILCSFVKDL